jgi:hypothetical protein
VVEHVLATVVKDHNARQVLTRNNSTQASPKGA